MSRTSKVGAGAKVAAKIVHEKITRQYVLSGMASAGPPLGPLLGQRGINIAQFCKEFNERTSEMKPGIPIPCRITLKPDRTFDLVLHAPPVSYFLKQAAGCERGTMGGIGNYAGRISLKHVYEIALIKSEDPPLCTTPMQHICNMVIGQAISMGIDVVDRVDDPEEYKQFLQERNERVEKELAELEEKRQAKMLRTSAV